MQLEIKKNGNRVKIINAGQRFHVPELQLVIYNVQLDTNIPEHTIEEYIPPVPAITHDDIDAERDSRVENNFTYSGVYFQLDDRSQTRITAIGADARFAILNGAQPGDYFWADPDNPFGWIATNNDIIPMDAQTMVAFSDAAKLWVIQHTFAGRLIKDMDPLPGDYKDDSYWPGYESEE